MNRLARVLSWSALGAVASIVACSSGSDAPGETVTSSGDASASDVLAPSADATASNDGGASDASSSDASDAATPVKGPPPSALPVSFARADQGTPLTQAELDAATDELITLLKDTRFFDVVAERVHGWPESDPNHGYWYGTWWSGVTIKKQNGQVSYVHTPGGADNNGLRTPQYMEGACYAHLMWGDALTAKLVRRIVRGYSSWALSMVRYTNDPNPTLLSRAHYPPSVQSNDDGRSIFIDYSQDRPGEDNSATVYVHLPQNPTFGDIWAKNKRSKDDIGHMLRGLAQVQACVPRLDAAGQADVAQALDLYGAWSRRVEDDGFSIATLDQNLSLTIPPITETLAHYVPLSISDVECPGQLAIRLLGRNTSGSISCGSGFSSTEKLTLSQMKNGNRQILRTHHEAALNWALLRGETGPALDLLKGMTDRITTDLGLITSANPPSNIEPNDIVSQVIHAANAGVPLTSNEVRWLHGRLHTTYQSLRDPSLAPLFHVFDPSTPDGEYGYDLPTTGMPFSDLALLIGTCASPLRNPTGRAVLDCDRLLQAFATP